MERKTPKDDRRGRVSKYFTDLKADNQPCEFTKLIEAWVELRKLEGVSSETVYNYADNLARFRWWWMLHSEYGRKLGSHPRNVTPDHIRAFIAYLKTPQKYRWGTVSIKADLSDATCVNYGRMLKAFFNFLEEEGHIEKSPFKLKKIKFTTNRKPNRTIKYLTTEELAKLFTVLTHPSVNSKLSGKRDLAMFSLLLDSGVRRGELLSIRIKDLELSELRCKVNGKSGERTIFFSAKTKTFIEDYLKMREEQVTEDTEEALWITENGNILDLGSFRSAQARLSTRSGVIFYPHQFRHTFAQLISANVTAFELRDLMGHQDIRTTQLYVQQNPERLATIYKDIAPLDTLERKLPGVKKKGRKKKEEL